MKLARSLIGVFVANEPFVTEYFYNLSPPLQGATLSLPADRHPWPSAIAVGTIAALKLFSGRLLGPPPNTVLLSRSPRLGENRGNGQTERL